MNIMINIKRLSKIDKIKIKKIKILSYIKH